MASANLWEAALDAALVLVSDGGRLRGTGFAVDSAGSILTCHHVVDDVARLRVTAIDGTEADVPAEDVLSIPELDLAIIRCRRALGRPLPIAPRARAVTEFVTKGYHRLGEALPGAFPVQGRVIGSTPAAYATATCEYRIPAALVLRDDAFDEGLSGAPVMDPARGVVVGVVSTKLVDDRRGGGLAVPLDRARASLPLRELFDANERTVPAYGLDLNVSGLLAACTAQVDEAVKQLTLLRVSISRDAFPGDLPRTGWRTFSRVVRRWWPSSALPAWARRPNSRQPRSVTAVHACSFAPAASTYRTTATAMWATRRLVCWPGAVGSRTVPLGARD